jgi:hypothetical protein
MWKACKMVLRPLSALSLVGSMGMLVVGAVLAVAAPALAPCTASIDEESEP